MVRPAVPSTLSLSVRLRQRKSTSSQRSAANSSRRAPVMSRPCRYALMTGLWISRTLVNQKPNCSRCRQSPSFAFTRGTASFTPRVW
ncbi:hypothetical protein D9M69_709950 [compost metagenome]